jgi:hypothetical protein
MQSGRIAPADRRHQADAFPTADRGRSGGSVVTRQRRRRAPPAACQDPTSAAGCTSRPADLAEREGNEEPPGSQTVCGIHPCSDKLADSRYGPSVAARNRACPNLDPACGGGACRDRRPAGTPGIRRRAVPLIPRPGWTWGPLARELGRFDTRPLGATPVRSEHGSHGHVARINQWDAGQETHPLRPVRPTSGETGTARPDRA